MQWVSPYAHNAHFLEGDFEWSLANWKSHWGAKPAAYQVRAQQRRKVKNRVSQFMSVMGVLSCHRCQKAWHASSEEGATFCMVPRFARRGG